MRDAEGDREGMRFIAKCRVMFVTDDIFGSGAASVMAGARTAELLVDEIGLFLEHRTAAFLDHNAIRCVAVDMAAQSGAIKKYRSAGFWVFPGTRNHELLLRSG
jgi:hypothetical protein